MHQQHSYVAQQPKIHKNQHLQKEAASGRLHKGGRAWAVAFGARPPLWIPLYDVLGDCKHSKNIQTYQQICIEYVYSCIYLPYPFQIPIIPLKEIPPGILCSHKKKFKLLFDKGPTTRQGTYNWTRNLLLDKATASRQGTWSSWKHGFKFNP